MVNQIRGLLSERGLRIPKGRSHVDEALEKMREDATLKFCDSFLILLGQLKVELDQLTARIEEMDAVLRQTVGDSEACQRLTSIPGIGPVTQRLSLRQSATEAGFVGEEIWGHGLVWFRASTPQVASKSYSASVNRATTIYEGYSSKEREA